MQNVVLATGSAAESSNPSPGASANPVQSDYNAVGGKIKSETSKKQKRRRKFPSFRVKGKI